MSGPIRTRGERSVHFVQDDGYDFPAEGDRDTDVRRERAVMVRAWEQLRAANLLGYGVRLDDRLHPIAQARYQRLVDAGEIDALPATYEAAMRVLVTDQNDDGHFDLNLDALMRAHIVRPGATREQIRAALLADPAPVSEDRIEAESSGVSPWLGRGLNATGAALHREVGKVQLRDAAMERARAFARGQRGAIRHNAGLVASHALAEAKGLADEARPDAGARLLFEVGAGLIQAGKTAPAERLLTALDEEPFRRATFNGMGFPAQAGDQAITRSGPGGRVRVAIDPDDHDLMGVTAARLQRAQAEWIEGLRAAVGPDADPYRLDDVREYFSTIAAEDASVDTIATHLRNYASAFYVHAGSDVAYLGWPDENARPAAAQEIIDSTVSTIDGRRVIDCEGFTYLASHLAGEIQGQDGTPRFNQWFVSTERHITLLLYDLDHPGQGIYVDNDGISARHSSTDDLLVADLVHQVMGRVDVGGRARAVALSPRPGDAYPYDASGLPQTGPDHLTVVGLGRLELDSRVLGAGELKYRFVQVDGVVHDRYRGFWDGRTRPADNDVAMTQFLEAHAELLGPEISHSDFLQLRRIAREGAE